jgi:hypothetical protein
MLQYRIISGSDTHGFEEEVNDSLKNGWKLYGSLCFHVENKIARYAQAIVKDVEFPQPQPKI